MSDRAYTVSEIDALRKACEQRYLFGSTNRTSQGQSIPYYPEQMAAIVETRVRTHMMAGHTAQDLYVADNPELARALQP